MTMKKQLIKAADATEAQELIERLAEENKVAEVRRIEKMKEGQVVRQGDIYIHCVAEDHKRGDQVGNRQLAMGDSMGSRHVAEAPARIFRGVRVPSWCGSNTFLGPVVVSEDRFVITHPEHAHVDLPAGTYQITHQLDARSAERVKD
jgi:hypothetical protein